MRPNPPNLPSSRRRGARSTALRLLVPAAWGGCLLVAGLSGAGLAEEPAAPALAPPPPTVASVPSAPPPGAGPVQGAVSLDPEGRLLVGLVRLDPEKREVSLPASVNMTEGLLEYALVSTRGKLHESLLVTPAEPLDLQIALLLLGMKGNPTLQFQGDPRRPEGDPVEIRVDWIEKATPRRERLERLITNQRLGAPMPPTSWIHTGSTVRNGVFLPQVERSLVATYNDPGAIINNPSPEGSSDEVWFVNTGAVPPRGTSVTVTIRAATKEGKNQ